MAIVRRSSSSDSLIASLALAVCLMLLAAVAVAAEPPATKAAPAEPSPRQLLDRSRRIVFLGDSITAAGAYVADFDAWLLTQKLANMPVVIDAGLPSETVSGLSEEGHAGGQFPRPDLVERLDRVLAKTKPDLVLACYGINCGIYQPFSEDRLQRYQQGIERLKQKVEAAGATLVLVTPPLFDDSRAKNTFSYNAVLDRYAAWLIDQRARSWLVIDLHEPMARAVAERRKSDPGFTFQPDAVHPNDAGHWFIAQQICNWFGDESIAKLATPQALLAGHGLPEAVLPLLQQRVDVLRDAYVAAAGHKRPGVAAGLPIAEAEEKAAELTAKIQQLLAPGK